ncbi:MAG TPA: hypothetical protein VGS07_10635 [Thermoanaerobaculia bacterium]|jgi:hypothetical protein|nr:hypothetical protein [Thermoanaerobaculia bacterium]
MKNRILLGLGLTSLFLTAGAFGAPAPQDRSAGQTAPPLLTPLFTTVPPKWEDRRSSSRMEAGQAFEASRLRQIVADLPPSASVDKVEVALFDLLPQIYRATNGDLPVVAEVVASLRRQPGAVEAMARQYRQLPAEAIERRLVVLSILGEMKRSDAMAQLHEVIWAPLPPAELQAEKLTARDLEEMIQVKAVQGLAYLATPQADAAVREVIEKHQALHVRVSAIDAYMWNHGDSPATAAELYRLLPADLHLYVERPRFQRGMDREEFTRRLRAWQEKWGSQPPPAPTSAHDDNGSVK